MAHVVECLPSQCEALSSKLVLPKKNKVDIPALKISSAMPVPVSRL
jgi:hypothetical protein